MKSFCVSRRHSIRFGILTLALLGMARVDTAQAQTALVTVTTTTAVTISTNIPVPASSGTTYVLQKAKPGQLTITGQVTGGAGSVLRTTTDTSGDTTTIFEFNANNSSYLGDIQLWRGTVQADNAFALGMGTIFGDGNDSTNGDLTFGANMTFTNPIVLQENETISSSTRTVTLSGPIGDGGGGFGFTKYGSGTLTLAGANTYGGTTVIGGLTAVGGTLAVGFNNALPAGNPLTIDNRGGSSVLSLGTFNQNVGAITLFAGAAVSGRLYFQLSQYHSSLVLS